MRSFLPILGVILISGACSGQRVDIKPLDFQPLTSLPWKDQPDAPMEKILERIFLESNLKIRYPVLEAYLKVIPVAKLNIAFDVCIALEGTQNPEELVSIFLPIWAERDPKTAWQRTQGLFRLKAVDWLDLDSWKNPKIEVPDRNAVIASRFYLNAGTETFPLGVEYRHLLRNERIALMSAFAAKYLETYDSWPRMQSWKYAMMERSSQGQEMMRMFEKTLADFHVEVGNMIALNQKGGFEILLRRSLLRSPKDAPEMVRAAQGSEWNSHSEAVPCADLRTSDEFFLLWAKADKAGLINWLESSDTKERELSVRARGILLSLVDEPTRKQWLAKTTENLSKDGGEGLRDLLVHWATWDAKPALQAAAATQDSDTLLSVAFASAFGINDLAWNTSHHGLGVINDFDLGTLPVKLREAVKGSWGVEIMEQWGCIDVGEAARYGFQFLLSTEYCRRSDLIEFFSGHDNTLAGEDGMVDRTFCALRTWAVLKPDAMRSWIATQEGEDMRKALTWLLENPWGTGVNE